MHIVAGLSTHATLLQNILTHVKQTKLTLDSKEERRIHLRPTPESRYHGC